jgi:hypothetical protein
MTSAMLFFDMGGRGFATVKSNWHARENAAAPDHHKSTRSRMVPSEGQSCDELQDTCLPVAGIGIFTSKISLYHRETRYRAVDKTEELVFGAVIRNWRCEGNFPRGSCPSRGVRDVHSTFAILGPIHDCDGAFSELFVSHCASLRHPNSLPSR